MGHERPSLSLRGMAAHTKAEIGASASKAQRGFSIPAGPQPTELKRRELLTDGEGVSGDKRVCVSRLDDTDQARDRPLIGIGADRDPRATLGRFITRSEGLVCPVCAGTLLAPYEGRRPWQQQRSSHPVKGQRRRGSGGRRGARPRQPGSETPPLQRRLQHARETRRLRPQ
jgi:hypothetical protein